MAKETKDGIALSQPRPYLTRMILFIILAAFVAAILYRQIETAFLANPGLNGLILGVLVIGILYAFRQVQSLRGEVRWVNDFRRADPGLATPAPPLLLAPMATMLGGRTGRMQLNALSMRSILDSLGSRLDEQREISRYVIGLLIFLGLLGTFWGLLTTVTSVAGTIQGLSVEAADPATVFANLKAGLDGPLRGMGTAFSSSLFGLAGSLLLGFLDLQAGQAQNRFYNELEEWLSTVTNLSGDYDPTAPAMLGETAKRLRNIEQALASGGDQASLKALAGQIIALTEQMQAERQLLVQMAENQRALQPVLEDLAQRLGPRG
ncbi:MAG: flagellar motor protein MotA [Parvibaculum sp.]|uniref:flagellar motor protein MotA n=1 Tax=Parvibaculum sp. TaxID=2024848 RepID=UPI002ABB8A91|nr:flagellar motor protein MotA [Parvibaculum sp.]MDZ4380243.1 flagellar motor protein MotA [Parvibaculum sp.]